MILALGVLIGGAVVAGGAIAAKWEADNDADEEELEKQREQKNRFLKMRRSQHEKNKRKKLVKLELMAREKELKLVLRAEKLARRQLDCGLQAIDRFHEELGMANRNSVKLPPKCVDAVVKELFERKNDLKAVCEKCERYILAVRKRITELSDRRFFYRCASCRRKFSVPYRDLEKFTKSRKGMRKCCDGCFSRLRKKADARLNNKRRSLKLCSLPRRVVK